MTDVFQPASAYALITFAVGFALGTLRVLWLAPKVGHTTAALLELPLMLCASFLIARWAVARWCVPARPGQRLAMGAAAFAILMFCEALVSITLFGNGLSTHLARYLAPAAWPGLAAQLVFAGMPLLLLFTDPRS